MAWGPSRRRSVRPNTDSLGARAGRLGFQHCNSDRIAIRGPSPGEPTREHRSHVESLAW